MRFSVLHFLMGAPITHHIEPSVPLLPLCECVEAMQWYFTGRKLLHIVPAQKKTGGC
jgi:hypothetical protein